jgi:hypothetical protein
VSWLGQVAEKQKAIVLSRGSDSIWHTDDLFDCLVASIK